jgi:hypothetical protein
MGDAAAPFCDDALAREDLPPEVKGRLVRALSRSRGDVAIELLGRRLFATDDRALSTGILRALAARQKSGTALAFERGALVALAKATVAEIAAALGLRVAHEKLLASRPGASTTGAELLQKLLRDEEVEGIERLFLVLALLHPHERFARIQRGLTGGNAKARASSRELLENVVEPSLRAEVLAVTDDAPDEARLDALGAARAETSYDELVLAMVEQGGALGVVAAFHAKEIGLRTSAAGVAVRRGAAAGAFGEELVPA